jgi:predicted HAD superfamily Cof-like phosphohydrolase
LIAEACVAMQLESTADELGRTMHAHPTVSEAVMEAPKAFTISRAHIRSRITRIHGSTEKPIEITRDAASAALTFSNASQHEVRAAQSVDGKPLSCATETTLKPEQHLELYRYLKLTRLVKSVS